MSHDPTAIEIDFDPRVQRMRGVAAHGYTPFDVPFVSHIEGNLWQGGCQNGLILPDNFQHVISLYPWEQYTVKHELRTQTTVRLYDSTDQDLGMIYGLAEWVVTCMEDGPTLVHCQAGLNRSAVVAATALLSYGAGRAEDVVALLREKRSPAVLCNPAFESFVLTQGEF